MYRPFLLVLLVVSLVQINECQDQQLQMPDDSMAAMTDDSITLVELQKNISTLWTYIYELRGSVTHHLNHLRQHQVEMEEAIHRMEHHGTGHDETHASHTAEHSHSGENSHSHGTDQHSHSGENAHSHGSDQHSHSGEHHHHHSGEQHSHSGEQHSHSGEQHSHGDGDHSHDSNGHSHGSHADYHSHSHSHSHTEDEHSSHSGHDGHDHHHGPDHKDSHENADDLQQTSQVAEPLVEPVIVPTRVESRRENTHRPSSRTSSSSQSGSSDFQPLGVRDNEHHHHHHHHHSHSEDTSRSSNRSRIVVMPKYSEYDLYEFAVCNVKPNRAIPEEQQQNIMGQVSFWQKKIGGNLNIHVRLSGFEMEDHHAHHQQQQQDEDSAQPASSHRHGFHVHAYGDLSNGCQSAGPHYNPKSVNHGGPNSLIRHVGDLGNIECDDNGVSNLAFSDGVASLLGPHSIVGKALVIHSSVDDLGLGDNEESLRTGNAGARLACCVIQKAEKLPFRMYKAMKTAVQYNNR